MRNWYLWQRHQFIQAKTNAAHHSIFQLANGVWDVSFVNQNILGLHEEPIPIRCFTFIIVYGRQVPRLKRFNGFG